MIASSGIAPDQARFGAISPSYRTSSETTDSRFEKKPNREARKHRPTDHTTLRLAGVSGAMSAAMADGFQPVTKAAAYFTAPKVNPCTSCFWVSHPSTMIGATARSDAADSFAQNRPSGLE
jgi:hypothetical protein